jgi:hypothetical protein
VVTFASFRLPAKAGSRGDGVEDLLRNHPVWFRELRIDE